MQCRSLWATLNVASPKDTLINKHRSAIPLSGCRGVQDRVKPHWRMQARPRRPVESRCHAGQRQRLDRRAAPTGCSAGSGKSRVVRGAQGGEGQLPRGSSYPSPRPPAVVVPVRKVLVVGRVDGPEVALPVVAPACFDEAVIQGQVMTHAVPPVFILFPEKKSIVVKSCR